MFEKSSGKGNKNTQITIVTIGQTCLTTVSSIQWVVFRFFFIIQKLETTTFVFFGPFIRSSK